MKKFSEKLNVIGWISILALVVLGASISDNVLRIGAKSGADIQILMGDNGLFKWDNAGQKLSFSEDGGTGFTAFSDIGANEAGVIENITVDTSVAANAMTIDSKVADGTTDPSAGSPHRVAFRDSVAADGAYNFVSQASSLGLTITSGATLGHADGVDGFIYIYALDNVGAMELAVSSTPQDESVLQTTVTMSATADDDGFYSTTGRVSVPIRLIARVTSNQVTAGVWLADVIKNVPGEHLFTHLKESKVEITDGASGVYGFHSSYIDATSGTPLITRQSGTWISSLTDTGLGVVTVNFAAGTFSVAPECGCIVLQGTTANCSAQAPASTSSIAIETRQHNAATLVDSRINIFCSGPK